MYIHMFTYEYIHTYIRTPYLLICTCMLTTLEMLLSGSFDIHLWI